MKTARRLKPDDDALAFARPLIARACKRTGDIENPDDIERRIVAGEYALILLEEDGERVGICVFQDCGDYLHIISACGVGIIEGMETWLKWWARIALTFGYKALSLNGRRGWERVLAPFGFKRNGNNMEVTLAWA